MAQWVKNLPAMQETQETWVQSLCQEDPMEMKMATQSNRGQLTCPKIDHYSRTHLPKDFISKYTQKLKLS